MLLSKFVRSYGAVKRVLKRRLRGYLLSSLSGYRVVGGLPACGACAVAGVMVVRCAYGRKEDLNQTLRARGARGACPRAGRFASDVLLLAAVPRRCLQQLLGSAELDEGPRRHPW